VRCGWVANALAALSWVAASTIEYNMISFLMSPMPAAVTALSSQPPR
jgi:hypothetical protein